MSRKPNVERRRLVASGRRKTAPLPVRRGLIRRDAALLRPASGFGAISVLRPLFSVL